LQGKFMTSSQSIQGVLGLEPQYRDYVWGGSRLRPGQITAEAWVVYEGDRITNGPLAGRTLAEAAAEYGASLLGQQVVQRFGARFPLLVKLLDCAQWLSLQVHPNDEQAVQMEGPGHFGKTEAWHILEADPGAEILCGFQSGAGQANWQQSVRDGTILNLTQRMPVHTGETVFIRPGTLHALGPGLLVYEVQQTSDITYRVFDWNRPASAGRKLHIDQSLAVLDPSAAGKAVPPPPFVDGSQRQLVTCPYFTLSMITLQNDPLTLDPAGKTFHTLTVIEGQIELSGSGWQHTLNRFETAVMPASSGAYQIRPLSQARILKATVEDQLETT
jgi:mannose-6-phosphate isomerase